MTLFGITGLPGTPFSTADWGLGCPVPPWDCGLCLVYRKVFAEILRPLEPGAPLKSRTRTPDTLRERKCNFYGP